MMHAGVEGQTKGNIIGETPYEDFLKLKEVVDYLALGHYHNAYELDAWAYNPGSPDTCSLSEVNEPKGFYHVKDGKVTLIDKQIKRRPFIFASVKLEDHLDAPSLIAALEKKVASMPRPDEQPVRHRLVPRLPGIRSLSHRRRAREADRIRKVESTVCRRAFRPVQRPVLHFRRRRRRHRPGGYRARGPEPLCRGGQHAVGLRPLFCRIAVGSKGHGGQRRRCRDIRCADAEDLR